MDTLTWCVHQKKGIQLIDQNENLADAYMKKSEEALVTLSEVSNISWKLSAAYYAMYFSVYAIFQQIGVKSEIHKCTILLAKTYLSEFYNGNELQLLKNALDQRIESQYYTTSFSNKTTKEKIIKETPKFIAQSKLILSQITQKKISSIRNEIIKLNKSK